MSLRRLDAELVRRSMARSREHARELIESGIVRVKGTIASKAATQVSDAEAIDVVIMANSYVSRGAHKLIGALDDTGVNPHRLKCLDAGASTGGFTQVLLERGAASVIAVDVGYGQLAWPVRTDPRVTVLERTNVRMIGVDDLAFRPELIVADLSFISLTLVLPALTAVLAPTGQMLLMVKPQFEVGRDFVGNGVVSDPRLRAAAVDTVCQAAAGLNFGLTAVTASKLPGPSGNVEYFVHLRPGVADAANRATMIATAVQEGPQ